MSRSRHRRCSSKRSRYRWRWRQLSRNRGLVAQQYAPNGPEFDYRRIRTLSRPEVFVLRLVLLRALVRAVGQRQRWQRQPVVMMVLGAASNAGLHYLAPPAQNVAPAVAPIRSDPLQLRGVRGWREIRIAPPSSGGIECILSVDCCYRSTGRRCDLLSCMWSR